MPSSTLANLTGAASEGTSMVATPYTPSCTSGLSWRTRTASTFSMVMAVTLQPAATQKEPSRAVNHGGPRLLSGYRSDFRAAIGPPLTSVPSCLTKGKLSTVSAVGSRTLEFTPTPPVSPEMSANPTENRGPSSLKMTNTMVKEPSSPRALTLSPAESVSHLSKPVSSPLLSSLSLITSNTRLRRSALLFFSRGCFPYTPAAIIIQGLNLKINPPA